MEHREQIRFWDVSAGKETKTNLVQDCSSKGSALLWSLLWLFSGELSPPGKFSYISLEQT